jgi:hypothetical protein
VHSDSWVRRSKSDDQASNHQTGKFFEFQNFSLGQEEATDGKTKIEKSFGYPKFGISEGCCLGENT